MAQPNIETCFNYCSREAAYFSSNELKWINRIRKFANDYPDQVTILAQPEDNDGVIYARLPISFFRLQAPQKQNLTDEQKDALSERLRKWREKRAEGAE